MAQLIASGSGTGSSLLVDLPDEMLHIVGRSLSSSDICNLSVCCKRFSIPTTSDEIWFTRCEELGILSSTDLIEWRKAVLSYKALCRFLTIVKPLLGTWVQQNPTGGKLIYVMLGFASVVGCRVFPQIYYRSTWSPVFEVISDDNGAPAFILHGRENGQLYISTGHGGGNGQDYIYPGTLSSVNSTCNALFLEVERSVINRDEEMDRKVLSSVRESYSESSVCVVEEMVSQRQTKLLYKKLSRFWSTLSKYENIGKVGVSDTELQTANVECRSDIAFNKLSLNDKEKLLETVLGRVGIQFPDPTCVSASLFPCLRNDVDRFWKDIAHLSERRATLIKMHKLAFVQPSSSEKNKESELDDFHSSGDAIGLTLQASTIALSFDRSWPRVDKSLLAMYKYPIPIPTVGREFAGLWGGTSGWPPRPGFECQDRLLFVVISYYEKSLLTATTISYKRYVGGSRNDDVMFNANLDEPSTESFPWDTVGVKHVFSCRGHRPHGSELGLLFVLEGDVLAFIYKGSTGRGSVFTMQRLDLEMLLQTGKRVVTLPPIINFSYSKKSLKNLFLDLRERDF